jgi:hypothetical protein
MKQTTSLTGHIDEKNIYRVDFLLTMNEELAEFAGILLGDGSINIYPKINHYRLKITLNSNEDKYANYVQSLFFKLFNYELKLSYRKNENTLDLLCFNRKIIRQLIQIGFVYSPKWNRATIPEQFMNKELGRYVLRGYFDTDGCVVIANNNGTIYPRLEMKIMPSSMKEQFQKLLNLYGFKYGVYEIGRGEVRIQMNGKKQLEKWRKEIGFSNKKIFNCKITGDSNH